MVEIIKATITHLSDVQLLNNKLFETEWYSGFDDTIQVGWSLSDVGKAYFADMITNHSTYIAMQDNEIIGYLSGSFPEKESYVTENYAEINNMYVLDTHQHQGIGSKLVDAFKKECLAKNICAIKVTASTKNLKALAFYEKSGFESCNITLKYKRSAKE